MAEPMDVAEWAMLTSPPDKPWRPAPHLEEINRWLMKIMTGECRRLIIEAPPRHGKTELVCKKFPGLFLQTFPRRKVGLASYGADLSTKSCRYVRDQTAEFGPRTFGYGVHPQDCSEAEWSLVDRAGKATGGSMRAFGVGGGILGDGFDLWIIDDPIKADESRSPTVLNNCWEWWKGTAMDRLNPGGTAAIIVMMQRLNERDLVGRLKEEGGWDVLTLRAAAEEDDVLGRAPGDYLWPEAYGGWDDSFYEASRAESFWWASKYQQRPFPRGGGMIQTAWIEDNAVDFAPAGIEKRIRWWDFAATEGGGDYSVGALLGIKGDHVFIEDIRRGQWGPGRRDGIIKATCDDDNRRYPNVTTWGEQQPGPAGKPAAELFTRMLVPHGAFCELSGKDKETRAGGIAAAFSRGDVHVCRGYAESGGNWYRDLVAEMSAFPAGKHDDIVDACASAYNKIALGPVAYSAASYSPDDGYGYGYGGAA